MTGTPTSTICVCIASCERPMGLGRLLESLAAQDAATPPFEVVVVDNDAAGTAGPVIAAARARGFPLRSAIEPRRNIARARNRCLEMAEAPLVAFIDDDETAARDWLLALYTTLVEHKAHGVFGAVEPVFAGEPAEWIKGGGFFLDRRQDSGTPLAWFHTRTSNALLRRDAFTGAAAAFDEAFGVTGGEDCALFDAMIRAGRQLVAAPDGVVLETIPPDRMRLPWLVARHFRDGNIHWRITARASPRRPSLFALSGDLAFIPAGLLMALFRLPSDRGRAARHLCRAAFSAGRIATGVGYHPRPYAAVSEQSH